MKSQHLVDLAYEELCEVIPELREEMDRACRTTVPGLGRSYFSEPNIRHKLELPEERPPLFNDFSMYSQNVGDWVKRSIMGDMTQGMHAEAMTCLPQPSCNGCYQTDRRPRDEMENYWLMQKTQQIAQSRSDDGCTCVQYTPDVPVPRCTCQFPEEHAKIKLENLTAGKQNCYRTQSANQDVWMNELLDIESQNERLQKEKLIQSLAVPDLSLEYPHYMGYHDESSIYEQEQAPMPLINNLPEKPTGLSTFQRVPKSTNGSADASPVNSPKPPQKAKSSRPRLCHFLLELLANPQQYSDVVEWVDKEKGVFKFLNSSEVASQWGRRRNKPHMKYENFARSLRTYIAKGILTKPRSKLVYRFTNKVY